VGVKEGGEFSVAVVKIVVVTTEVVLEVLLVDDLKKSMVGLRSVDMQTGQENGATKKTRE
jgi:hypothetical protein